MLYFVKLVPSESDLFNFHCSHSLKSSETKNLAFLLQDLQPICHLPGRFGEDWSVVGGLGHIASKNKIK